MGALQFEMGVECMIEACLFPAFAVVALIALLSETPQMHVIDLVAARALLVSPFEIAAAMALGACDVVVLIEQWKRGLVVIEGGFTPMARVMTLAAFLALTSFMHVIILVTANALLRGLAKRFAILMALRAGYILVMSFQLKIGIDVLKGGGVHLQNVGRAPLMFRVAKSAFAAGNAGAASVETRMRLDILRHRLVAVHA